QKGKIDFTVDGAWQLDWTEDKSVRRLDLAPDTAQTHTVARFEYFRQPCDLAVKVSARPSRISVEPAYRLDVEPRQVRIEGTLRYRFRGARATALRFDLGEWKLDQVTPDGLLELPIANSETPGRIEIPIRPEVSLPPELELKFEARRAIASPADRISLTLPRPL